MKRSLPELFLADVVSNASNNDPGPHGLFAEFFENRDNGFWVSISRLDFVDAKVGIEGDRAERLVQFVSESSCHFACCCQARDVC